MSNTIVIVQDDNLDEFQEVSMMPGSGSTSDQSFQPPKSAKLLGSLKLQSVLQRLPGVITILFLIFLFLGPVWAPEFYAWYYTLIHLIFGFAAFRLAFGSIYGYYAVKRHTETNWQDLNSKLEYSSYIRHYIILPQYKEDEGTVLETLEVLESHRLSKSYKIVLAMEESEDGCQEKARKLIDRFKTSFDSIQMTIHPFGIPHEARGKGSNVAWAAKEILTETPLVTDLITIMDADTCFASDYFEAVTYYYASSNLDERKLMFFCCPTVFDRNADKVPFIVRAFDMIWSQGVLSYFSPLSTMIVAISTYTLSLSLAVDIGLWDSFPSAIGEDWHMCLKCHFSTNGNWIGKRIFSPASQSNVEGKGSFFSGCRARYIQAKRHFWGALDIGYFLRRLLFGMFAPGWDAPYDNLTRVSMSKVKPRRLIKLLSVSMGIFYGLLEEYFFLYQSVLLIFTSTLFIPGSTAVLPSFANLYWKTFRSGPVPPFLVSTMEILNWARIALTVFVVISIVFYEYYQSWAGTKRWTLYSDKLGKRSSIQSKRTWLGIFDWFSYPIFAVYYLIAPCLHTQILQLFTENLDYVVASKPVVNLQEIDEFKEKV